MKEKILTCARDCFLDEGLSHFSMRKVASCAGVSATAIYRHYTDKEELLYHVILQGFRIFSGYLRQVDELLEPLKLLEQTAMTYLEFALSEPAYYETMFMTSEQMTGLKWIKQEGGDELSGSFAILQQRVQSAIDTGVLNRDDSYRAAFGIWAFAHGQISLYLTGRAGVDKAVFIENYRSLIFDYLHS